METSVYRDIAARTGGSIYIGVVGPVRTGKSTFIKRFMETLVLPGMEDVYAAERAKDELPQSGSGRTIMTAEPKFIPENAARLRLDDGTECTLRMVDSVGFMVEGAAGNMEDGAERMVMTPWYDYEIPMSQAAAEGTQRVIAEHSTIGLLITTDGSVCGLAREDYVPAEMRAAMELNRIGKPYVILLNCADPDTESAQSLAQELSEAYGHACIPVNCLSMDKSQMEQVLALMLREFPVMRFSVYLPAWMDALGADNEIRCELFRALRDAAEGVGCMGDSAAMVHALCENEMVAEASVLSAAMDRGEVNLSVSLQQALYYQTISRESGFEIRNDRELMLLLHSICGLKEEYDRVHEALESVRETGYGIVMPTLEEMKLEEPQIVRQGGRYGVRLKASAPSIHMIMANIETEVSPAIGGEKASEEVINFLLQGYDGDINRIWESNIFGKPLNDIAGEGLNNKIRAMPEDARGKLRTTIQRIINEGSGGLICIIL
ncbi:MAG: stage IV sporulation protein A [Ruminococcaceae bacterium]|nr:stage IV sporulation protein A [Oscillospiraceae bacterium]